MEQGDRSSRRSRRLDLLAAHIAGFDLETPRARDRLDSEIGSDLATLLVAALSRSVPGPLARTQAAAAAA